MVAARLQPSRRLRQEQPSRRITFEWECATGTHHKGCDLIDDRCAIRRPSSDLARSRQSGSYLTPLEEIAPTARITFEQAWYAALDLIELRLLSPAGVGFYSLTDAGTEAARRL